MLALIHVFLDNARYHHAKLVQDWLSRRDCRIRLHFIPAYCPHLNAIERLWGVMHSTSRTTNATRHAPNSPTRRSVSCGKRFSATGRTYAIRSPTISASYRPRIFGLWRERGIIERHARCHRSMCGRADRPHIARRGSRAAGADTADGAGGSRLCRCGVRCGWCRGRGV